MSLTLATMRTPAHKPRLSVLAQDPHHATILNGGGETLSTLAPEWEAISLDGNEGEPFFTPYWVGAFADAFERKSPLAVVTTREGRELRGVLPFVRRKSFFGGIPARTLQSLSGIHSCRFDLTCAPRTHARVAEASWRALRADRSWDVIEALNVPEDGTFNAVVNAASRDGFLVGKWTTLLTPVMTFPSEGGDPFVESPRRYSQVRSRLKNYHKKLEKQGAVSFEIHKNFNVNLLEKFLRMESAGWKGKHGGAIALNSKATQFYHLALSEAAKRGHLRFHTLRVGEEIVAMEIGLLMNNRYYSPKLTYDERYSNCSPGNVLNRFILETLAHEGVAKADFLGPRARHKVIWTDQIRPHAHCYIFRPTIAGRLRHAAAMKVAPAARRLKHSWYGDPQAV
jgi:CelD/BcsL family acetyltransferase involved in cellulose biosynthesis